MLGTEKGAAKRRPARACPAQRGRERLPVTLGRARAAGCHTAVIPYGHIGIHIPPLVIHAPRLLLAEVPGYTRSFPTATCASSCLHRHKHMSRPGEAKVHIPQLCSWRDLTQNLQLLRRDLNSCLQWSEPSLFGYSFPEAPGVNGL